MRFRSGISETGNDSWELTRADYCWFRTLDGPMQSGWGIDTENIDGSLLNDVQRVVTKSYTSGGRGEPSWGDNTNIHYHIVVTNDSSNDIRWVGRLWVKDTQGRVVYRKRISMEGDNCIGPNEKKEKYVSYSRNKDSFSPYYGNSSWGGINLPEPELTELQLYRCD